MKQSRWRTWLPVLVVMVTVGACRPAAEVVPAPLADGWKTALPSEVGMDAALLQKMVRRLERDAPHLYHSILVAREGKLVFETYFSGQDALLTPEGFSLGPETVFDAGTRHMLASVSKSVTSLLVGIAIDRGLIESVNDSVFAYLPAHQDLKEGATGEITLADMLTMQSGIPWDESFPYSDLRNDLAAQFHSPDPVRYVMEKPLAAQPGTRFAYNSGTTNVLGEVVRNASGMSLVEFAGAYLFGPLGIESYEWRGFRYDPEMAVASSALYLRPRDMAKLGQLVLQKGEWNGEQVVSAGWIEASSRYWVRLPNRAGHANGYGYQWWVETSGRDDIETIAGKGHGMQFILALPELEMVVVFTGGAWQAEAPMQYDELLEKYILPAVID